MVYNNNVGIEQTYLKMFFYGTKNNVIAQRVKIKRLVFCPRHTCGMERVYCEGARTRLWCGFIAFRRRSPRRCRWARGVLDSLGSLTPAPAGEALGPTLCTRDCLAPFAQDVLWRPWTRVTRTTSPAAATASATHYCSHHKPSSGCFLLFRL